MTTSSTVLTDPTGALLQLLAGVVFLVVLVVASRWLGRIRWRERMLREVTATMPPDKAAEVRRATRAVPLMWTTAPRPPQDPYLLTHRIVIDPLDGRPGEAFDAPGPAASVGVWGMDGTERTRGSCSPAGST